MAFLFLLLRLNYQRRHWCGSSHVCSPFKRLRYPSDRKPMDYELFLSTRHIRDYNCRELSKYKLGCVDGSSEVMAVAHLLQLFSCQILRHCNLGVAHGCSLLINKVACIMHEWRSENLPPLTLKGVFEEVVKKMQSCRCDLNPASQLSPPATVAES